MMSGISMVFCGDTSFERSTEYPFSNVEAVVSESDIAFCNVETCVVGQSPAAKKRHVITSDPGSFGWLRQCGFNVANVANNHIIDMGKSGCQKTLELLEENGIAVVGLRDGDRGATPAILEENGTSVGFLGYADYGFSTTLMPMKESIALEDVRTLTRRVDTVVVSLHWGYEYVYYPSPRQQAFARKLVDAGATLVVGHHPHVIQGVERYGDGLIAYSLGNFQFHIDEMPGENDADDRHTNYGFMLRACLTGSRISSYELIPVSAYAETQVRLLAGQERERAVLRHEELSEKLKGRGVRWPFWINEAGQRYALLQVDWWVFEIREHGFKRVFRILKSFLDDPILSPVMLACAARFLKARMCRGRGLGNRERHD